MSSERLSWSGSFLSILAFVAVFVTFGWVILDFRADVERWVRRDLAGRAQLAAENLAEPLRTQDFRRIGEIAGNLKDRDGILLTVFSSGGGVFYRVPSRVSADEIALRERIASGEHVIELAFDDWMVHSPFYEALFGFAAALLVGVFGMFIVFSALFRQRVRIRELARLERFRRDFVADVSHEIKTPLTGILGSVEMLEDADRLSPEMRLRLLKMISVESKRLNALVQQILNLSRLEREGDVLNRENVDLSDLARELAARYPVEMKLPSDPVCVFCDSQRILEALSNLVENAIRHSGSMEIAVSASVVGRGVEIAVEDHGVGIPSEHAVRIFDRFHRVDSARGAETGGAGLGLAIVRRIARLHGGDVTLTNVHPHGCRFTIFLPLTER
jgi:signal transduction histidine kinase